MLKIFEKSPTGGDPAAYTFHFNSASNPRAEANEIKDMLSRLISTVKTDDPAVPRKAAGGTPKAGAGNAPAAAGGGSSAAMTLANTVAGPAARAVTANIFDDEKLRRDIELQQSLMKADKNLFQIYMDAYATKPENMPPALFNKQFWNQRIDMLRAYAIENSQRKAPYNVLAIARPTIEQNQEEDGSTRLKLNITKEQIQLILALHPLVKRLYNENVPRKLSEEKFWERFFLSKLAKQLRGEKPNNEEKRDDLFDIDAYEDVALFSHRNMAEHIPHIIDVEANEENQGGFKGGNRKDSEMRPSDRRSAPIFPILNSMSLKLLERTAPADRAKADSADANYDPYQELTLRDLREDTEDQRIILNIKEQGTFFNQNAAVSDASKTFAKQKPEQVLKDVQGELAALGGGDGGGIDLHGAIGIDDDSDSEDEAAHAPHVGSRASRKDAQKQILESMLQRRAQVYGHSSDETSPMGLPADIASKCGLTHVTTTEFLHQFWSAFLSGDPDRAGELGYLADALRRSKERIEAVAAEADEAREAEIKRKKEEVVQIYERTKKKVKFNSRSVRGGRDAVMKLMGPALQSLDKAIGDYQRALAAEGIHASTE